MSGTGFARMIEGIVREHAGDDARLTRGAAVLDDLYAAFSGPGLWERGEGGDKARGASRASQRRLAPRTSRRGR